MSTIINTSKAKQVTVNISDIDNIPLSFIMYDTSVPPKVAIDLEDYAFNFFLKDKADTKQTYTIDAGDLTSTYLSKTGASNEVLNMQLMWQHIRTKCVVGAKYRLIMEVTRPDLSTYVFIVFNTNASNY